MPIQATTPFSQIGKNPGQSRDAALGRARLWPLPILLVAIPALLLSIAGCGSAGSPADSKAFTVRAAASAIDTNATDRFTVSFPPSRAQTGVKWSIAGGQNDPSIGQGAIDANGLYTPPPLLSRDVVQVEVKAAAQHDPALSATYLLTLTPGFTQPLRPQEANLAPGSTLRVTGEIAEINSGSIHWSLAASPSGGPSLGSQYGHVNSAGCQFSSHGYTKCAAVYTAPASPPASGTSFYLVGSLDNSPRAVASVHLLLNGAGFSSSALQNQSAQDQSVEMGSSGGNANDYDSSRDSHGNKYVNDCCGGTLGGLVTGSNGNLYILSNNHVLAESDQARPGDTIVEPALIDLNCNPQAGRTVGALRYVVPLQSRQTNVDAALAAATSAVDPSGGILQLGSAINGRLGAAAPAAGTGEVLDASRLEGLRVVKSGRTTGLTCSTVDAIDLTVQVDYYYDCAETQPYYTKTYRNQIGIPGAGFADSGDSGALVLDAGNAEPIGLLFSNGSSSGAGGFSVANPIQDVLGELGEGSVSGGQQFKIVGGARHPITCSNYDADERIPASPVDPTQLANAKAQADSAAATLMRPGNGILGTTAGSSLDRPGEAAVILYVDRSKPNFSVPKTFAGFPTRVVLTDAAGANAGILPPDRPEGIHLPANVLRAAAAVQRQYAPQLMRDPAFFGVGVTQSHDNPAEAALLVLVDTKKTPDAMPGLVGGLRVRYLKVGRLHVTRSKYESAVKRPTSCQLLAGRR
jgi:hypothetical protein